MATDVSEAIEQIVQERNISEELALQIVESTVLAAYKRKFGNSDNAVVRFDDERRNVTICAQKQVVDGVYDPTCQIELEEAKALNPEAEEGDELLIELNPKEDFGRVAVQSAKQSARQNMREIHKDSLYSEYKDKEGDIIIGYYQRERNGTIYVDLGKIEGVLPKKFQSPREIYHVNDRIKALVCKVEKTVTGLQVVLSRTHTDFVKAVFETEVPEVYDKTIEIHKIVREPGYRTKLAVYSTNKDVDPVAACVGPKGSRIQAIIRELEGEKIDVLEYNTDPIEFIMNALSPAEVRDVVIVDEAKHQALAVVAENQLSLAIGKQGQNVRLANRLVDWNIDVKTIEQYESMDIYSASRKAVSRLFGDEEEISRIAELPGIDDSLVGILLANGIEYIEDFFESENKLAEIKGLSGEQIESLRALIDEHVIIDYEQDNQADEVPEQREDEVKDEIEDEEEYECPECGTRITLEMDHCPVCGVELSFEEEDE
jgi:N utilization substance protein A